MYISPSSIVSFLAFAFSSLKMCEPQIRTQDIAFPVAVDSISVAVSGPNSFYQFSQSTLVFQVNLCECNNDACFPMDQPSLSLDDIVNEPI